MKRLLASLISFLLVLLVLAGSLVFNYTLIDVRLDDLNFLLYKAAQAQDENRSLGMLARFELIRRRMERGADKSDDYELEGRVQAVLASGQSEEPISNRRQFLKGPARFALNIIRVCMGKDIRRLETETAKEDKVIEAAYFWERNRHYDKASAVYAGLLKNRDLTPALRRYILLHQGFCLAMVSKYAEARKAYEEVIRRDPNSEAAVVAWKVLDFLDQIQRELKNLHGQAGSNFEKGKSLYLLMDYRGAIREFSMLLQSRLVSPQTLEGRFLKGRAHEELGETREALDEYKKILALSPQSDWGREANRRIYILGEFYERDAEMTKLALQRIQEYRDASFFGRMQEYSTMIGENDRDQVMRVALRTESVRRSANLNADDIEKMLNNIDLDGSTAARKQTEQQAEQERKRAELDSAKTLDLSVEAAMDHPFRSPSAIKDVVDKNLHELQYLYQRALRSGKEFEGKVVLRISVLPAGKVKDIEILNNSTGNPAFVTSVIRGVDRDGAVFSPDTNR